MNTTPSAPLAPIEDEFGRRIAARLARGSQELPHDISERLRAARVQALARRKVVRQPAAVMVSSGSTAAIGGGWWTRIGSVVPLVALVAGLMAISVMQDDIRTNEIAEVDSALLTDDLPPAAYTDPGFAQFLKSESATEH